MTPESAQHWKALSRIASARGDEAPAGSEPMPLTVEAAGLYADLTKQQLSDEVLAQCRERLSFGPLTLPHELARLVLYEQLYRALSITGGIKYHREPL